MFGLSGKINKIVKQLKSSINFDIFSLSRRLAFVRRKIVKVARCKQRKVSDTSRIVFEWTE